jgi:threonine synthase
MDNNDYINTYIDTRGSSARPLTFTEAVLTGIAASGGLYVPKILPHLDINEVETMAALPYAYRASYLYRRFGVDIPAEKIGPLMVEAYGHTFDTLSVAPVREVAPGTHVLELWHGPTSAFKDMALQCLPVVFTAAIEQQRAAGSELASDDYLVLVATSGDTGKAALEGFKDRRHTGIAVFYPDGGVSDIQRLQMVTQAGANVQVCGMKGNFDTCQSTVKGIFADAAFNEELHEQYGLRLSSANSINWGRLMPQIVYYVSAYADMVSSGAVAPGAPMDVCVPTGNFGNILACWYAESMGVPIGRLLCASNENNVLTDFIRTGVYDIRKRDFKLTPSPSMDILISSNLERQLFELCGRDGRRVAGWMADLARDKRFEVDASTLAALQEHFCADWVSNDETLATIKEVYDAHHYLLDPHTAVAWKVAERLRGDAPVLVVSTAHWAKFGADVYRALHELPAGCALPANVAAMGGVALNRTIAEATGCGPVPPRLDALGEATERFTGVCEGSLEAAEGTLGNWLENDGEHVKVFGERRGTVQGMKDLGIQVRLTFYHDEQDGAGADERSTFGKGIATLLRGVMEYGSLNAAAKHIHMAYSKAWRIVKETESGFGFDLIDRDGARGSTLTPEGKKLLDVYEQLEQEADSSLSTRFTELLK